MKNEYKVILLNDRNEMVKQWYTKFRQRDISVWNAEISDHVIEEISQQFAKIVFTHLEEIEITEELNQFSEKIVNLGWPLAYLTEGIQILRTICLHRLIEKTDEVNKYAFIDMIEELNGWIDPIKNELIHTYSTHWMDMVSRQKIVLEELSTPLIPVVEGITIMPLIGTIDEERGQLINQKLLTGVAEHRSEVVLLDITGVPTIDTMVAHYIVKAAEAVRLIGTTCILVGIRPEISQTISNLGIDLSKFITKSSLKQGFGKALELTNRELNSKNENAANTVEEIIRSLKHPS
ncbi:STAS domain-containing protein [Gracilibacillus saliphilus]|uniref:STAS domain-containing protein n=1 Tax=Gracilibacillus saliphilus TaxID=543890 RepID=UPI0013D8CE0C|nr:STAS domain-containing protein [Gracilibacillus saliphilus]